MTGPHPVATVKFTYSDPNRNGKHDEETGYSLHQKWMALRIADINFVRDTILQQAKDSSSGGVYRLIDPGKIGLMGHSLPRRSMKSISKGQIT